MVMVILDPVLARDLIRERRRRGLDAFDEVWNGVYVMSPSADNEHQLISGKLYNAFDQALSRFRNARVYPPINVSDRPEKWRKNFRCPDISVFLADNPAIDKKTHWYGGPDFVVEILSPYDRSRKKLNFYAKLGVRELLLVDRKPWSLELYRLLDGELKLVGRIDLNSPRILTSDVLPLSFRLLPGHARPTIEVDQTEDTRQWLI